MDTTLNLKNFWRKRIVKGSVILFVIVMILCSGLVAFRLITGKSLGIRSFVGYQIYRVKNLGMAILDSSSVKSNTEEFSNIVFVHHSTGNNLIQEGIQGPRKHTSLLRLMFPTRLLLLIWYKGLLTIISRGG